jgi:hypothetical protein
MAKFTTGYTLGVTKTQMLIAQQRAEGESIEKIARLAYDCTDGNGRTDPAKLRQHMSDVRKHLRNPKVQMAYKEILKEFMADFIGPAIKKVGEQVNDSQGWLANKAANDVITRFFPAVLGEEDRKIVVQIEGMPELGTPDKE